MAENEAQEEATKKEMQNLVPKVGRELEKRSKRFFVFWCVFFVGDVLIPSVFFYSCFCCLLLKKVVVVGFSYVCVG